MLGTQGGKKKALGFVRIVKIPVFFPLLLLLEYRVYNRCGGRHTQCAYDLAYFNELGTAGWVIKQDRYSQYIRKITTKARSTFPFTICKCSVPIQTHSPGTSFAGARQKLLEHHAL